MLTFNGVIVFLIIVVVLSIAFTIVKYLIMPVVPVGAQPAVWAIIGILLLIALLYLASSLWGHTGVLHP